MWYLLPILLHALHPPAASSHQIPLTGANLINWTAKKTPQLLFDGSIAADSRIDNEFAVNAAYALPHRLTLILGDSAYNHLKIEFYHEFGTYNWVVNFYDSNKVMLHAPGTYTYSGGSFGWNILAGTPDTISRAVRFVELILDDIQSDVREIRVYGDKVARCSDIIPKNPAATILADPGIEMQGGSDVGGKDTNYLKTSLGYGLYGKWRAPSNTWNWNNNKNDVFAAQSIGLTTFGDVDKAMWQFWKYHGVPVMLYMNGGSIKASNTAYDAANGYVSMLPLNNVKDIPPGGDSTSYAVWASNQARTWKALAYLWGNNTSGVLPANYVINAAGGTNLSAGQGKVKVWEIGNEDDKTWEGVVGFHSPRVLLYKIKACVDSILSIDPTALIATGALLSADTMQWRAMAFINYWENNTWSIPGIKYLNFNQYLSDAYGGQPQGGGSNGVSPEQFNITRLFAAYGRARDTYFPGAGFHWTEIGYVAGSGSDYDVHAVTGFPDSMVQANFNIRCIERAAMVPNVVVSVINYKHTSDGNGSFSGMYNVVERNTGWPFFTYTHSDRRPNWWWFATRMNTLHDYKGWVTTVQDGDSTGVSITRYDHKTDALKKIYAVWRGTYNGSTSSQVVNVSNAHDATLVTMAYGSQTGTVTPLTITSDNVTVTANEGVQYIVVNLNPAVPPVFIMRGKPLRIKTN